MKKSISLVCMLFVTSIGFSQFKNAIESVITETETWIDPLIKFLYVMVAIVGVYGIFKIFGKIQTGDQDTGKAIAQWVGGFIFLIAGIFFLKALQA
ncbi:DUF4134 family protein [Tenacibaculum finnmarkense]|uniref:DUF4134 family protein n=2 Tax=Tenacibaculum finnmarkense TaxID=2781243 RepID=UPI00187B19F0|nr:DUF4134 family protein [Tenacibaculum finnmarkense]MCD8415959.1 DUF4134 domain-containing protein [Tenacibaculum dicentrarchi]MBE7649035.1 DUF4134 domain-containing protein [Tenacibaculum finnmarkense genomovar ulcerans]MCD8421091.1 DUF4134 domain-containing protein [Tenacibaculum dicentrarchi]MCD8455058.1 DUF4134 domain-containing protein [Tenacibaculum finnmarkense genomovar ulcerans]MCG8859913.1 DUF4134 domain-containing protein [Tenacibaculum finnmarkense]